MSLFSVIAFGGSSWDLKKESVYFEFKKSINSFKNVNYFTSKAKKHICLLTVDIEYATKTMQLFIEKC